MKMFFEPSSKTDELVRSVVEAALEVHKTLGPGFIESVYEESLTIELALREIPYERQKTISVNYKGNAVGESRLDLLIGGLLIVELKAVEVLLPVHKAQLISYLKATGYSLGLLINFNTPLLKDGIKRVIHTQK